MLIIYMKSALQKVKTDEILGPVLLEGAKEEESKGRF